MNYVQGHLAAFANSKSLREVAVLAAGAGWYGHACALNVHAAEEMIKALACLIIYYEPEMAEEFEKVFHSHKEKHRLLKECVRAFDILRQCALSERARGYFSNLVEAKDFLDAHPGTSPEEFKRRFPLQRSKDVTKRGERIRVGLVFYSIAEEVSWREENLNEVLHWLSGADVEKKSGLYVDLSASGWTTPDSFSKERFEQEDKLVTAVFGYCKCMSAISELSFTNQKVADLC